MGVQPVDQVIAYHNLSKHSFAAFAPSPGYLDWDSQPDPFRRYPGSPLVPLPQPTDDTNGPSYGTVLADGAVASAALDRDSMSALLYDSLALSAWKRAGDACWPLRVNPSSGNLHPTEAYLLAPPVAGLWERPSLVHYAPREHGMELRGTVAEPMWSSIAAALPHNGFLIGLASVPWRESWKYGERAFRYCQHDVGHAISALALAASALGWRVCLVEGWEHRRLQSLLGLGSGSGPQAEWAECLLAVFPADTPESVALPALDGVEPGVWAGQANTLEGDFVPWAGLAEVSRVCADALPCGPYDAAPILTAPEPDTRNESLRQLARRRRSAVAMNSEVWIRRDAFLRMAEQLMPRPGRVPFGVLPWGPQLFPVFFVHRVDGLRQGLYLLCRDPEELSSLRQHLNERFQWEPVEGIPEDLPLYRLIIADGRALAAKLSCQQAIARDGCFTVAMLSRFEPVLRRYGAGFYPRLFWEAGMLGQVLYLEAHAAGVAATGIGCYFDDPVHQLLGLQGLRYQVLYHFTVGAALEDPRILTLPPYPGPDC